MPVHSLATLNDAFFPVLDGVLRTTLGVGRPAPQALAAAVAHTSAVYNRREGGLAALPNDNEAFLARLLFFSPRDLLKIQGPVLELVHADAWPQREKLRVLDLGAGLGAMSLGLSMAMKHAGVDTTLDVTAVDVDARALSAFSAIAAYADTLPGVPMQVRTQQANLSAIRASVFGGPYDVIVLGFVLNELARTQDPDARITHIFHQLRSASELLAPGGVLIVLEPALRSETRVLMQVRDVWQTSAPNTTRIFGPCVGAATCPMLAGERDWCHETLPVSLPGPLGTIAKAAGLRDEGLSFSYLTLKKDAQAQPREPVASATYRVVSNGLNSKGKVELMLCGARGSRRLMRLDRDSSAANQCVDGLGRGDLIALSVQTDAAEDSERVRIRKDDAVDVLHGWPR